jgi:hypothetical protein
LRRLALIALVVPLIAGCGFLNLPPYSSGATAQEALASSVTASVPRWITDENLPPKAVPGAKLFAVADCTACHTYDGAGESNLGARDLTAEGLRNANVQFQMKLLACPSCVHPGSPMPTFASLGAKRLRNLALFLAASQGVR